MTLSNYSITQLCIYMILFILKDGNVIPHPISSLIWFPMFLCIHSYRNEYSENITHMGFPLFSWWLFIAKEKVNVNFSPFELNSLLYPLDIKLVKVNPQNLDLLNQSWNLILDKVTKQRLKDRGNNKRCGIRFIL